MGEPMEDTQALQAPAEEPTVDGEAIAGAPVDEPGTWMTDRQSYPTTRSLGHVGAAPSSLAGLAKGRKYFIDPYTPFTPRPATLSTREIIAGPPVSTYRSNHWITQVIGCAGFLGAWTDAVTAVRAAGQRVPRARLCTGGAQGSLARAAHHMLTDAPMHTQTSPAYIPRRLQNHRIPRTPPEIKLGFPARPSARPATVSGTENHVYMARWM